MRKPAMMLDAGDKRAIASGAAVALGVVTLLALRADWFLADGMLHFHRTGQNVAAYVLGANLLPWAALFTAATAMGAVAAAAYALSAAKTGQSHAGRHAPQAGQLRRKPSRNLQLTLGIGPS